MPWGGRQHSSTQWDRSAAFWHCIHRCVSHFLTRAAGNDKPCRQHDTLITVTPRKNVPLQGSSRAWCCHQGKCVCAFPREQTSLRAGEPRHTACSWEMGGKATLWLQGSGWRVRCLRLCSAPTGTALSHDTQSSNACFPKKAKTFSTIL